MKQLVEDLQWRYATKKYDSKKSVSDDDISIIKQVLQLVPTSYGLQPLKFLFIENTEIRTQLLAHSFGQQSIVDASHLLVICSYKDIETKNIDSYIKNTSRTREIELKKISGFGTFLKNYFEKMSLEEISEWTARQGYIALGFLMQTCAALRIDATPMEGFDPSGYSEVLKLAEQNLNATLVVPFGYRHEEDANQYLQKVRRSEKELFAVV